MKINAKQMKKTVLRGLNKAGEKMTDFGSEVAYNANKIVAGTALVCTIAGAGCTLNIKEKLDEKAQSKYEQSINEIEVKRGEFVNAGANEQALAVFDEQNPKPEQPENFTKLSNTLLGVTCGLGGTAVGVLGGTALVAAACGVGVAGYKMYSATRKKEEEMAAAEKKDMEDEIEDAR
jgi:hypothetical protein